jgi:hypothetical protein
MSKNKENENLLYSREILALAESVFKRALSRGWLGGNNTAQISKPLLEDWLITKRFLDHDFAKKYWEDSEYKQPIMPRMLNKMLYTLDDDGINRLPLMPAWEYHLQQIVLINSLLDQLMYIYRVTD